MSTNIHKVMGYGIRSGVNTRALMDRLFCGEQGEVARLVDSTIAEWRETKRFGYISLGFEGSKESVNYPKTFADIVKYAEHPDDTDGWWVVIPPMQNSWFRFADVMDAYEASPNHHETAVKELNVPLYPYLQWMHKDTGLIEQYPNPDIVPYVPEVVRLITEHLGMPDWKLFRPVIIRWYC